MERVELAIQAAKKAGEVVKKGFYEVDKSIETKTHVNDVLTKYDTASQEIIISLIKEHFADDAIIAEEGKYSNENQPTAWVIDPIDGTKPFSRQIHTFAISIAFMTDFHTDFSVVYNPVLDELLVAIKGEGLTKNGKPIHCAHRTFDEQIVNVEGFGHNQPEVIRSINTDFHVVSTVQSSAFATALLSQGKIDGYISNQYKIWDRVHYLLITESGAKLTRLDGSEFNAQYQDFVACAPEHYEKYFASVQKLEKFIE